MTKIFRFLLLAVLLLSPGARPAFAAGEGEAFDPVHHVSDGYYLDLTPFARVELPRLFLVRHADGSLGFDAFATTAAAVTKGHYRIVPVAHGEEAHAAPEPIDTDAEAVARGNAPLHAEGAPAEGAGHADALESKLAPPDGAILVDFSISRHLVFALLGATIVLLVFLSLAARYRRGIGRETAPRGLFQNLFETLILFVRDEIARPTIGEKYERYLPYLLTAFFFILTCNLLGLVPFGATATSNLMITAVLAAFTFVVTQLSGSKDYWKHIFWPPGVPTFVKPILIPVEVLGMFTKPFALAIRLFANMTAGHLVILSLIGLIFSFARVFGAGAGYGISPVSVAFALFIYLLEILVALIQAYIFTMLSGLFIGMAAAEHHHAPEEGHLPEGAGHPVAESQTAAGRLASGHPEPMGVPSAAAAAH